MIRNMMGENMIDTREKKTFHLLSTYCTPGLHFVGTKWSQRNILWVPLPLLLIDDDWGDNWDIEIQRGNTTPSHITNK